MMLITSLALAIAGSAQAAVMTFSDRVSFNTVLDADTSLTKSVQGWDTFTPQTILPNGAKVDGVTYTLTTGEPFITNRGLAFSSPNTLVSSTKDFFPPLDTFTLVFNEPILAFGVSLNTFSRKQGSYRLTTDLNEVALSNFDPFPGARTGQFAGLISNMPFRTVTIAGSVGASYGLDNITFARREAVPEPNGALTLGAFSLLMVVHYLARS